MKLCRFQNSASEVCVGKILDESTIADLSASGIESITEILEDNDLISRMETMPVSSTLPMDEVVILTPVEKQEVWAAGVTYLRSKKARMEESDFSANAYDQVYDAPRPEIFFKSLPEKVMGPDEFIGIRADSQWNVPEPELVLVTNSKKELVGVSIGNDMSSRDIEGENLLYLPQAKVYDKSCAIGPWVVVGSHEEEIRQWTIGVKITRQDEVVFTGETSIDNIKRNFSDLVDYLGRSQSFPYGAMLLTGTGVVPGDDFTLAEKDVVSICISGIGTLQNTVTVL
ncbi:MAG TPA: fumarylacetoacetate hydrolase [Verrucomicrobiales bacterium]|nr:fumarylacetoacetate hydrolase [Verrucomicrobiales bacterium]